MKQCSVKGCHSSAKDGVRLYRYQAVIFVLYVTDFNPDQIYLKITYKTEKTGPGSEFGFRREKKTHNI